MNLLNNNFQPQPVLNQVFGSSSSSTAPIPPGGGIPAALVPSASLYDESMDMLSTSAFMYTFSSLRDLARSDKTSLTIDQVEVPLSATELFEVINSNKEALMAPDELHDDELEVQNKMEKISTQYETESGLNSFMNGNNLVEFVDEQAHKELVHAIFVNHIYKRITVAFRGSVTQKDFITDVKVGQEQVDKPGLSMNEKEPSMNIHSGFHKYLFKKSKETEKTRYDEIIESVKYHLKENPGYRLYCCGHSLGGALATLFGLYAASDSQIHNLIQTKQPIRIYSVASPLVGNVKFRNAFQMMEHEKKIQHFRMANIEDVVTQMPVAAPNLLFKSSGGGGGGSSGSSGMNLYKHCGIKLLLLSEKDCNSGNGVDGGLPFELSYTQDQSSDEEYAKEIETVVDDMKNVVKSVKKVVNKKNPEVVAKYHGCETYETRLKQCKPSLQNITLDDLYNDQNIVGKLFDPNFEPQVMTSVVERIWRIGTNPMLQKTIKNAFKKK